MKWKKAAFCYAEFCEILRFSTHIFAVVSKILSCLGALATKLVATNEASSPKELKEGLLTVNPPEEDENTVDSDAKGDGSTVSITIVGASGDLAKKKIFPALFALYYEDCLPEVCPLSMPLCRDAYSLQNRRLNMKVLACGA